MFFSKVEFLDKSYKKQWVLSQVDNRFDYAVLGSSRGYGAFEMRALDSLIGAKGINISSNGSGFKDNFLMLHLFLKNNIVENLFLQVDLTSLNSRKMLSNEFHAYTFLPYWNDSVVRGVLRDGERKYDNRFTVFFPEWRYFLYNKYFSPKEIIRRAFLVKDKPDLFTKHSGGLMGYGIPNERDFVEKYSKYREIDQQDQCYLEKILELAKSKNIGVVLFTAPEYQANHKFLKSVLSRYQVPIIFPETELEERLDIFTDPGHMNDIGREWFTLNFSREINSIDWK